MSLQVLNLKFNKPFLSVSVFVFCCFFSSSIYADINTALGELVASTPPGLYESQTRTSISVGSADIRFQRKALSLINISPPSFSFGCGGISAHFGGLSYVNTDEIMELLENAGQNAVGYLFELAFRALCGDCMETLKSIIHKIQQATKFAKDSCSLGKSIAEGIWSAGDTVYQEECANWGSIFGTYSDTVEATNTNSACASADTAKEELKSTAQNNESLQEEACSVFNCTWAAFKRLGIVDTTNLNSLRETAGFAQLLMSVTGAQFGEDFIPPSIQDPEHILHMFLCGRDSFASGIPQIVEQCINWLGDPQIASDLEVLACIDPDNNGEEYMWTHCDKIGRQKLSSVAWDPQGEFTQGFLEYVYTQLMDAVDKIAMGNTALTNTQKSLIGLAPFPLHKVINVAAVYPSVAARMVVNYSTSLSLILASAYFDYMISESSKRARAVNNEQDGSKIPTEVFDVIQQLTVMIDEKTKYALERIDYLLVQQESMLGQVNTINKSIMQSINARGLLGNQIHTNDLMAP